MVLGIQRESEAGKPMPATITQRFGSRAPKYKYLSREQLNQMNGDQTAYWHATFLEGHYWLEHRLPEPPDRDDVLRQFPILEMSEDA